MKKFNKNSIVILLTTFFVFIVLGQVGSMITHAAATSPNLGTATTYSVLAGSNATNALTTTISGNVGIWPGDGLPGTTGWGTVTLGVGSVVYDADATAHTAMDDKNSAFDDLDQGCDVTYLGVEKELAGLDLVPGVYCANRFLLSSGTLTLRGGISDIWIFKSASSLVVSGGVAANVVFIGDGQPCNVWWRIVSSATFDADSTLLGNILAGVSVTLADGASLDGRAFAGTETVTMVGNAISGPTCDLPTPAPTCTLSASPDTVDSGDTSVLTWSSTNATSCATSGGSTGWIGASSATSGSWTTNALTQNYTYSMSCTGPGGSSQCNDVLVTNIPPAPPVPPIIEVVKVPSPLSLPDGPGSVTYAYTLRNIGTVPATDMTIIDDSCDPVTFISGDTNSDSKLDIAETWTYSCTTTLSATHTNTVVVVGWANGVSATDTASSTVIVDIPIVPPLIHVTKVPSPLTLPAGGGTVTYTESITNPGTVELSNVNLTDDKCSPMEYISGDTNSDSKLDITETWIYTCQINLTETTTNTATASGDANALTATDSAIVNVIVSPTIQSSSGGGGGSSYRSYYVPPLIDLVKVPNPLALPDGPGLVKYTYTLRNIGTVPVTNITMIGDTCSPITLTSGDTNSDKKLNINETWIYNCYITLSETHTNNVVATGWANGISTTDIASATVVVGAPIVPPLIHITKIPSPLTLLAGDGTVTYTKKVTNPGAVALSNVNIIDDKCGPVNYISGDTNSDSKLDTTETWVYTCKTNLITTTTNTAMASGNANGLTAKDFAIATVVAATSSAPGFPNTGLSPNSILVKFIQSIVSQKQANLLINQTNTKLSTRIKIPVINVDAPIEPVGITPDGAMGSPKGPNDAVWYNLGPRPGNIGSAVIAGHYGRWKNGQGSVFDNLDKLQKGDTLSVEDEKGVITDFVVREIRSYDPSADTSDVFVSSDGKAHLNLITCEGSWNKISKSYTKRLVVFTDKE